MAGVATMLIYRHDTAADVQQDEQGNLSFERPHQEQLPRIPLTARASESV